MIYYRVYMDSLCDNIGRKKINPRHVFLGLGFLILSQVACGNSDFPVKVGPVVDAGTTCNVTLTLQDEYTLTIYEVERFGDPNCECPVSIPGQRILSCDKAR